MHAVTLKPSDKAFDMRTMGDALVSMIPEGFPDDPEKHKRLVDSASSFYIHSNPDLFFLAPRSFRCFYPYEKRYLTYPTNP